MAALLAVAQTAGGEFGEEFGIPGTESFAAQELLEQRFPDVVVAGLLAVVIHVRSRTRPIQAR